MDVRAPPNHDKARLIHPLLPFCPFLLPFSHRAHCSPHSFSSSALPHVCGGRVMKLQVCLIEGCVHWGGPRLSRSDHFTGYLFSLCLLLASAFLQSSPNWSSHVPANTMQWIVSPSFHFSPSLSPSLLPLYSCLIVDCSRDCGPWIAGIKTKAKLCPH